MTGTHHCRLLACSLGGAFLGSCRTSKQPWHWLCPPTARNPAGPHRRLLSAPAAASLSCAPSCVAVLALLVGAAGAGVAAPLCFCTTSSSAASACGFGGSHSLATERVNLNRVGPAGQQHAWVTISAQGPRQHHQSHLAASVTARIQL